jgi:hypothetical protein
MADSTADRPQIFVSYARVDDEVAPGQSEGWVTTFVKTLRQAVNRRIGKRDACDFWMGEELQPNLDLHDQIVDRVKSSAAMLVFLSPGYLLSAWTKHELELFAAERKSRPGGSENLFVVEMDESPRPPELRDFVGYRFWETDPRSRRTRTLGFPRPRPEDLAFYDKVYTLAEDLARALKAEARRGTTNPASTESVRPAVFLAESTDEVDELRLDVRRYLEQIQMPVRPERRLPEDAQAFRAELAGELERSIVFAQLLGESRGRKLGDGHERRPAAQLAAARARGLPIVQWRSRTLNVAMIDDPEHRLLLDGPDVMATSLEEFKEEVLRRYREALAPTPPPPQPLKPELRTTVSTPSASAPLVFVNYDAVDHSVATPLAELLTGAGAAVVTPLESDDPVEVRQDVETNLAESDGVVLVYGAARATWVRAQLLQCRKAIARRAEPLRALAVLECPPLPKADLGVSLPGMLRIDATAGLAASSIQPLLQALAAGSGR